MPASFSIIPRTLTFVGVVAIFAASAFAQTTTPQTLNNQLQFGDVFATMTVDARGASTGTNSGASSSATAVGNTALAANLTGPLNLRSRQTFSGAVGASATLTAGDVCCYAVATSNAQGNALEVQHDGGASTIDAQQLADGGDAQANTRVDIGRTSQLSATATASLNNIATSSKNGSMDAQLAQTSGASSFATVDADACCSGLTAAAATSLINAWSGSASTSNTRTNLTQTSTGATSRAAVDAYQVSAADITAAASANGNSATLASQWGYAQLGAIQTNQTAIEADARLTLASWTGSAAVSSSGVGNGVLASNIGSDLMIDVNQVNSGGVASSAQFAGGASGVDSGLAIASAAAIGNAATAWTCSACGAASAYGSVNQTNGGAITTSGSIQALGASGSVGSASAVGNSASFVSTTRQN